MDLLYEWNEDQIKLVKLNMQWIKVGFYVASIAAQLDC